ncbi:MAG TPA: MmcQ/YjbR family DNA-binding protein [Chloroflexota bacterium]|nr:MmcQ/YjbR family DNA-binding protein [Chloroflexota bacterium]
MTQDDVRALIAELPETTEQAHHDHPDFRVRGKIFATFFKGKCNLRLPSAAAHAVVATEPAVYAMVSDRDPIAWVGVTLPAAKEQDLRELLEEAWRLRAPADLQGFLDVRG